MNAELPAKKKVAKKPRVPQQAMPFGLMSRKETAQFLRIGTRTLDRLVSDQESRIPVVRLYDRVVFVPQDLMAWASNVSKKGGVKK